MDPRCIRRFIRAFPKRYREVVEIIIEKSEKLDKEVFRFNIATLMTSFKMTRRGAFHGVKIDKKDIVSDPKGVIDSCWKQVGEEILKLKGYINRKTCEARNRVPVNLSPTSKDYVIEKINELFDELCKVTVKNSRMSRVGASKILFAVLPETTLPVDNLEWKYVFKTNEYGEVLSTMVSEINEWERQTETHLDTLDPKTTLPSIYNIMAMALRPLRM